MNRFGYIGFGALLAVLFLLPPCGLAEDEKKAGDDLTVTGEVGTIGRITDDERESAKFEEYRDLSDGVTGDLWLRVEKKDDYLFHLKTTEIGKEDQYLDALGDWYGKLKVDFFYTRIPHRFAYDALSLYGGFGGDRLVLSEAMRADLEATPNEQLADRVKSYFNAAQKHDLEIFRDRFGGGASLVAFDPFSFRVEARRDERNGERPIGGSFGFNNTVEIPEPIDWNTTEARVIAEYARRPLYVNATYYLSVFQNNNNTLTWDNFFRATDSTNATAYLGPLTTKEGPSKGRIDLTPDNIFHQVALSASYMDLPMRSRISATGSWGVMLQDDDFVPFTTNTAIVPGAAGNPPFDASSLSSLPAKDADAKVNNYLANFLLTSRPLDFMHAKARFRYYEYDNDTDVIYFPGYVRTDAVWVDDQVHNLPVSYNKLTTGVDLGFDVYRATRLSAGYTYEKTHRDNREVERQANHKFLGAIDTSPFSQLTLRATYEHTAQDIGTYNFTAPFYGDTEPEGQLPFLRKYLQADLDRDEVQMLATVYPMESLAVTASFLYGKDDYHDSPFGLLWNDHYSASLDADYAVTERLSVHGSYTYEQYRYEQRDRQWNPGLSPGDPYNFDTGFASNSNWSAEGEDEINTFTGGFNWAIIPKRLDFGIDYSFTNVEGHLDFSSPLGIAANDANPFIPIKWGTVDETRLHILNAKMKYQIWKGISLTLGYLFEKFDFDDFDKDGFTNIPSNTTGGFNGAILMGTLIEDYDAHVVYTRVAFKF
jgi:MtrB/PioB family decaheme-associated outer membrane protein